MKKLITLSVLMLGLTACGGGSGSDGGSNNTGTVSGLAMPTTMSVVSAQVNTAPTGISGLNLNMQAIPISALLTDAGTDYMTDPTQTYVWDDSMESLQIVNMILCLMDQTSASEMVNQGAYTALINEDKCEQGNNQSDASTGGGSSSQVTEYSKWIIESTRADNSSPQIVKLWVPGDNDPAGDPMDNADILVEVNVTDGVSAAKPYGDFVLNFKGVIDQGVMMSGTANGTMVTTMAGTLQTVANADGKPQFQFIDLGGDDLAGAGIFGGSRTEKSNVILDDATGTSGIAKTFLSESYDPDGPGPQSIVTKSETFDLAFNSTNFLSQKNDGAAALQSCSSRTNFNSQVWRYNLYHETDGDFNGQAVTGGQRVELNSGFPFVFNGTFGHMSYWGLWLEDESVTLSDGDVINQFDYNSDATIPHTVHVSDGKLHRRTANTETLLNLQGKDFYGWAQHPTLGDPASNSYDSWVIRVTSTNTFEIHAGVSWGENGPQTTDLGTDTDMLTLVNGEQLWLWSDALGGNIVYTEDSGLAADRVVTFYAQDEVLPSDAVISAGATLYCYDRCPIGGVVAPANDAAFYYPFYEESLVGSDTGTVMNNLDPTAGGLRTYSVSVTGGKLTLVDDTNSQPVVVTTLPATYQWGMDSGEMLLTALTNVFHPEANNNPGTNFAWNVYDLAAGGQSFRWETGNNNWNRLTTVTRNSDSQLVSFDRPLRFTYTHSTANDANNDAGHDGDKFLLEYGGPGQFWGFPWEPEAGCDATTKDCRWHAAVTLKDGVIVTDGTNNFAIKAMEKEQSMIVLGDLSACASLDVTSASGLPLLTTVDENAVSFTLASKPTVTDAPAVIEGEIQ